MDFILYLHVPPFLKFKFLDEVEEIKKKAEEEEQRRIEAELASKKKRTHTKKSEDGDKTPV